MLTHDTVMLLFEKKIPKNNNGMHVNRPTAHTRGSALGLTFLYTYDAAHPIIFPDKPAHTVIIPKIPAILE